MKYSEMRRLIDELSLALEVASVCNKTNIMPHDDGGKCWAVGLLFQAKINELIKRSGRVTQEEKNAQNSPDIAS